MTMGLISKLPSLLSHGYGRLRTRHREIYASLEDSDPVAHPPLIRMLRVSSRRNEARFHYPGHNSGRAAPSTLINLVGSTPFLYDLPEFDNHLCLRQPMLEARQLAAHLFGAAETWFLVGGTTTGVQAAIMATCSPGNYIIVARNCHMSVISGMILSGSLPKYVLPDYNSEWDIPGCVNPMQVAKAMDELQSEGHKAAAVFVTSPTYHGICSDLGEISVICHSRGVPLIVDEAHGAHLGFHYQMPRCALQQGADIVLQSTHKVLTSLSQSSMLHISGDFIDRDRIFRCLQTLETTSPNALLLASLDAARAQIGEDPGNIFNNALELAIETKARISKIHGIDILDSSQLFGPPPTDPLRYTIGFRRLGLTGFEADKILDEDYGVSSEFSGLRDITYVINLGTEREQADKLVLGLENLSSNYTDVQENADIGSSNYSQFAATVAAMSPRDAFFKRKRVVRLHESVGKISGEVLCPYPPGIPLLIPGEVITDEVLNYLVDINAKGGIITGGSDPQLSSILICDC